MRVLSASLLIAAAGSLGAQATAPAIRPIGSVVATSAEKFGNVNSIRALSNGTALINDMPNRRVLLVDENMKVLKVVADTTPETGNAYSGRLAGLIPYKGDTSLFVDPQALSMLVIDPSGRIGRVMSIPRADDAMLMTGIQGTPAVDPQGRIIYRANNMDMAGMRRQFVMGGAGGQAGPPKPPVFPDTAAIVRIDLSTRKLDTLAWIKVQAIKMNVAQDENGRIRMTSEVNPLPLIDEWSVLNDGTLAIIRGRDYHVEFVNAEGQKQVAAKVPFDWQRLSDDDKIAFIDSVKAQRERQVAAMEAQRTTTTGPNGQQQTVVAGGGAAAGGGGPRIVMDIDGGGPPRRGGEGQRGGGNEGGPRRDFMPQLNFVQPTELPDYKPPFLNGAVRADMDGNLWVRTVPTKKYEGGQIYDVIDRTGKLIDRVQVPVGRQIIGFGKGGVVYMMARDAGAQQQTVAGMVNPFQSVPGVIEKAKLR